MIFKKNDQRQNNAPLIGGRRQGENENPYLSARRTWNDHNAGIAANRQMWQLFGLLALLIVLASVGGIIYIGAQSKFQPYIVEVEQYTKRPQAIAPAAHAAKGDPRIVNASVASFIADLRMVTPDIALQRKAILHAYAMLSDKDPATNKVNTWYNAAEENKPFNRAARETVSVDIVSVLPQTDDTWQVEWTETVSDRQGIVKETPFRMRALLTVYIAPPTAQTTEEQLRNNPLGIYVRDFSWSKQL